MSHPHDPYPYTPDQAQQHASPIDLYYTRCGAATATGLALRRQQLQAEFAGPGTVLHSLRDSHQLDVRNAHYHHGRSGLFREGGNIPPIWARGQGVDTVVVGITWLDEYQGVLVRADSNIRDLADLKGHRLAVPLHRGALIDFQRGAAQHGYVTALGLAGLTVDDVALVDVETSAWDTREGPRPVRANRSDPVFDALDRGEVDAVFVRFGRGWGLARDPRYRQLVDINSLPDPLQRVNNGTPRPITVDRPFLERHPEIVVRFLAVLLRTARWAETHRDEVIALLAADTGATPEEVVGSHGNDLHRAFTPALDADYVEGLRVQKDFLRDWGYLQHDFDVRDWIVREPLVRAQRLVEADERATHAEAHAA